MAQENSTPRVDRSVMSNAIVDARTEICNRLLSSPIPPHELIRNLGLFVLPMDIRRILFFAELYEHVLKVPEF